MRGQSQLLRATRHMRLAQRPLLSSNACRSIQISAAPIADTPIIPEDAISGPIDPSADPADARFEVLSHPFSLLSVHLSASQKLYSRRGALIGVSGKVENAQSTLSLLSPFIRTPLAIPFLYQSLSSPTPLRLLLAPPSSTQAPFLLSLNGTTDWLLPRRTPILAWTGHSLLLTPKLQNVSLSSPLSTWGATFVSGRGILALAAKGDAFTITLQKGEEYLASPANVLAYTVTPTPPEPYNLKSSAFPIRFQVPALSSLFPDTKFFRSMRQSDAYKFIARVLFGIRRTARRTIWGERVFWKFEGPVTLVVGSRAGRVRDVVAEREVQGLADVRAGSVEEVLSGVGVKKDEGSAEKKLASPVAFKVASVGSDGKVKFGDVEKEVVKA